MAELLSAQGAFHGLTLPLSHGGCVAVESTPDRAFSVMPFRGRADAVGDALGMPLPAPGCLAEGGGRRILWTGRDAWLLLGPAPDLAGLAAVTDVSDSFAGLVLSGPGVRAVLARLCPLDLHPGTFPDGATARTEVAHLPAQLTRRGEDFQILAARSFAGSLHHEVEAAMTSLAAQGG